jgi:hypothetical protein
MLMLAEAPSLILAAIRSCSMTNSIQARTPWHISLFGSRQTPLHVPHRGTYICPNMADLHSRDVLSRQCSCINVSLAAIGYFRCQTMVFHDGKMQN